MPKTETLMQAKSPSNPKADIATIAGVFQIITGSLLFIGFGIGALLSKILSVFAGIPASVPLILFLISITGGVLFCWRGIGNIIIVSRFRKISGILGKDNNIQLSVLEQKLGWNRDMLSKTLRRQMAGGFWKDAHLDTASGVFMMGYNPEYLQSTASGNKAVDEIIKTANDFIHEMVTINLTISDPALKANIEKLIDIARQIFTFVQKNPEKTRQIRQFSNYYLPMTVNLLKNYQELQGASIKGENIQESIQKISDSMATIETVFRNQLNDLYEDKALDISVDIEVLQNMSSDQNSAR